MTKISTALGLVFSTCLSQAAMAETAPNPATDLAIMQQKVEAAPEFRDMFGMFTQAQARPDMRQRLEEQLLGRAGRRGGLDKPFPYIAMATYQLAQARAQVWGQLLAADLNNDDQITKDEVMTVLAFGERPGIADAFFASDANNDLILTRDELKAEVERQTSQNRRYDRPQMAQVFDFDDDGSLTQQELDRGMAALGYAKP